MSLKGSKTEQNLNDAFAGESLANRRYLYFANKADFEGQNDVAALFRSTAEGETGHAHRHLEFLEVVGDPATALLSSSSRLKLAAAVAGETHEHTDTYPGMVKSARDAGFDEIADWFETLVKTERWHANRCQKALDAAVLTLDFPHLMLRAKAIKSNAGLVGPGEQLLASTDVHGSFAGIAVVVKVVNAVTKTQLARGVMDSLLGAGRASRCLDACAGESVLLLVGDQICRRPGRCGWPARPGKVAIFCHLLCQLQRARHRP